MEPSMVEQKQEREPTTPRRRSGIGIAVAYYLIAGLIGLGAAAWLLLSTVSAIAGGCYVVFHVQSSGPLLVLGEQGSCEQYTDLLGLIVPSLLAVILLTTAGRLRRDRPRLGLLVAFGIVAGLAAALLPLVVIVWAADFYDYSPGLLELVMFVGPFLWALASAVIVGRYFARAGENHEVDAATLRGAPALTAAQEPAEPRRGRRMSRLGLVVVAVILLVGLGVVMGFAARPPFTESPGTLTLRLERPIELADSGDATCSIGHGGDQVSVYGDAGAITVVMTAGDMFSGRDTSWYEPPRDDGLELVLKNLRRGPYAEDEAAEIASTQDSIMEGRWDRTGGSLRFSKLGAFPLSGGPPKLLDPDLEGTIEWTCSGA
jgi:hypothetical protein